MVKLRNGFFFEKLKPDVKLEELRIITSLISDEKSEYSSISIDY